MSFFFFLQYVIHSISFDIIWMSMDCRTFNFDSSNMWVADKNTQVIVKKLVWEKNNVSKFNLSGM